MLELNDITKSFTQQRVLEGISLNIEPGESVAILPELTAKENVALPQIMRGESRSKAHTEATDMLTRLGLGDYVNRFPGQLSGGQSQRVAIARALAGPPSVVFADEPTAALDQATGHEVMQQITAVAQKFGVTLVLVTHDPKIAQWCDRRIEIRDGLIHAEGAAKAVQA